jgi:spore germination protein YaaH
MGSQCLRRRLPRRALVALLGAGLLVVPAADARAPVPDLTVSGVRAASVRLVWVSDVPTASRTGAYRVWKDGRPFRRLRARSLRVGTSPGGASSFQVAAILPHGRIGPRSRTVKVLGGHRPPGRPGRAHAVRVGESRVRLKWTPSAKRSGRIAGYRIYRDGTLVRQVRGLGGSDSNLAPATRYRFSVAPIDTHGYLGAAGPAVSVRTAMPPPTRGRAHAFLLASTGDSFRDLQRNYSRIGTVYPTYFDCRPSDGALSGRDDPLVTRWSRIRRIAVLPRFNCQEPEPLHAILTEPALRAATIDGLVELVRRHGYDGINIDFENAPADDRDLLTAFVSDIAARLHAIGKRLAVEVSAKYEPTTTGRSGFYDYEALADLADHVFVMNWGWHWATSAPGAPDDLELCRAVADYVASLPHRERFVLGTHMYGMDWPDGGGEAAALEYTEVRALATRYGARPVLDPLADAWTFTYADSAGVRHEVWYPDASTIARRVGLARDRGLGVGFWRLGSEDQRVWGDSQIAPGTVWPG